LRFIKALMPKPAAVPANSHMATLLLAVYKQFDREAGDNTDC
jgi:hypothetical protein